VALELKGGLPAAGPPWRAGRVEVNQVHARILHIVAEDFQVVAEMKLVLFVHVAVAAVYDRRCRQPPLFPLLSKEGTKGWSVHVGKSITQAGQRIHLCGRLQSDPFPRNCERFPLLPRKSYNGHRACGTASP
jgi:hypothetical protein